MLTTSPVFDELYAASARRAEYRCVPIPGLSSANNPNVTVNQIDISGEPLLTQGYGDVETLILGNIFIGSLSMRIRNTNFPANPYRINGCFQFEMRFTSIEIPAVTTSEWLPLGRFIVSKADTDKRMNEYVIEAYDACGIFEMFEVERALGSVPELELPTTYRGIWERLDLMLAEYCRLNGLWSVQMPHIPIAGNTPVESVQGLQTREILTYIMLAWAGNMRANAAGELTIANIPDIAILPPKQDVYWQDFIPGEPELPIGVVRMSGGGAEESIYPEGSTIPTPADGISLFNYHSPWYFEGQAAHVFRMLDGFANKPFEAAVCFPNPAIEPGDVVRFKDTDGDYLVLYQQMTCGADPVFTLSCGSLSDEKYRGTVEGRLESALDGGIIGGMAHILLDKLPTPEEVDELKEDDVVLVREIGHSNEIKGNANTAYYITHTFVIKKNEPDTDFSITINSGTSRSFMLPTSGRLNSVPNSYNWIVYWGDDTSSEHSGTGTSTSGILHTYPKADTLYSIKITPKDPNELGWLRAFGFYNTTAGSNTQTNKDKVVLVDGKLTEQMIRTSESNTYVCAHWFDNCTNLTMGQSFNLPQELTSVGSSFCYYMFDNCTNLTMGQSFNLPQELTSVGSSFCLSMFQYCTNFTMNDIFQLPHKITSVGILFCQFTFLECASLTEGVVRFFGSFAMTQAQLNQQNMYARTFDNCTNLTEPLSDIPQLQMIPNTARQTFRGAPADLIAPLHPNWK